LSRSLHPIFPEDPEPPVDPNVPVDPEPPTDDGEVEYIEFAPEPDRMAEE